MNVLRTQVSMIFNPWPFVVDTSLEVMLALPPSDERQQVEVITTSIPIKPRVDARGNQLVFGVIHSPNPLKIELDVQIQEHRLGNVLNLPAPGPIKPEVLLPINSLLFEKATELTVGIKDDWAKVEKIFQYVREAVSYADFAEACGALATLESLQGDCGSFSELFCGLCRSLNIPAQLVFGWLIPNNKHATPHVWSEVYVNGWIPVDVSTAQTLTKGSAQLLGIPNEKDWFLGNLSQFHLVISRGTGHIWPNPVTYKEPLGWQPMVIDGTQFNWCEELLDQTVPWLQLP
jgi:transglutaminase-like putative cysteine protease